LKFFVCFLTRYGNPINIFPLISLDIIDCLKSIGQVEQADKQGIAANQQMTQPPAKQQATAATTSSSSSSSSSEKGSEVIVYKIHLPNRSYKSVKTTSIDTAESVLENLCEKLNLSKDIAKFLVLFERVKDRERRVKNTEMISDIVRMWPMILGETGNETYKHCYFMAAPLSTAPDYVVTAMS
jgi:hypothetical protein